MIRNGYEIKAGANLEGADLEGANLEGTILDPNKKKEKGEEVTAKKDDKKDNKAPLEYLEPEAIEEMCRVFAFGADKYGKSNYFLGHEQTRLIAAAMRHLLSYKTGEDIDPESGFSHIAHAQCCLAMLQKQKRLGTSKDDRITLDKVKENEN